MEINKVYNEDCLETMKRMPDNFVDMTLTSPPYDNLRDYKGYTFDFESIANNCGFDCHFQEPYGFVPEAGCNTHDK